MSIKRGFTIEFPATARLVFRTPMGSLLIVNPRECKGDKAGKVWPHCSGPISKPDHDCKENVHGPDASVPVSSFVDNQYGATDYDSPWFAFWEEDCMSPPISVVRASSFEAAYEDFLDTLPEAELDVVHTENVNGCEIKLIEVTCE